MRGIQHPTEWLITRPDCISAIRERRSIEPGSTPVPTIAPDAAAAEDEAALPSDSSARPDEDKKC